jgi:uncharacterized protein
MNDIDTLVQRYVALWNESDPARRRDTINALWAEGGAHFTRSLAAEGHAPIEARVAKAHDEFVASGRFAFMAAGAVDSHHRGVRFNWHMVNTTDRQVAAAGFDFLLLDAHGRILSDHQFTDPTPA